VNISRWARQSQAPVPAPVAPEPAIFAAPEATYEAPVVRPAEPRFPTPSMTFETPESLAADIAFAADSGFDRARAVNPALPTAAVVAPPQPVNEYPLPLREAPSAASLGARHVAAPAVEMVVPEVAAEPEPAVTPEQWPQWVAQGTFVDGAPDDDESSWGTEPDPTTVAHAAPGLEVATRDASNGQGDWTVDAGIAVVQPRSATDILTTLAEKVSVGSVDQYQPVPLGFTPLDKTIGGGLRAGELLLIGGAQGTGKTTMAMQMARNIVLGGQASVLYICFEHDEEYMLNRIISMESALAHMPAKQGGVKLQDVRREILGTWLAQGNEKADLASNPRLKPALERIERYGQNLYLLRGSQTTSTVENMRALITKYKELSGDRRLVVFVDYMQKVPVIPEPNTETEKVTSIVNGLKDVALSLSVPMISIVAADKDGLKAARLRNHHLRGSSAINYEADIILILNEKYNIVAKVNIEFNPYQAQRFRDWVIVSVEKNRGGQHSIDLEFQKHFEYSCFDASGRTVQEKLIEERLYND
jgi:replicative DNA helicase